MQPNFWRAPNDNDYGNSNPKRLQIWKESSRDFKVSDTAVREEGETVLMSVTYDLPAGNQYLITYRIYRDGVVNVNVKFTQTDREAEKTEVLEDTNLATFTPGKKVKRKMF